MVGLRNGICEQHHSVMHMPPLPAADLREKSAVTAEEWPFEYEGGTLKLKSALGVNDVYFFEIG